jgi:hypothetical protein
MVFLFGYAGAPDGYAPEEATFWWVAIAMGVGVWIVVILLLGSLVSMVNSIQQNVRGVRDTLQLVRQNTANAALIPITADRVDSILAEGLEHHAFLTRVLAG